tara:strand:+ start:1029 stop:2150 length:1122 start_codon:yes stop_codon:yes gene_type:complete
MSKTVIDVSHHNDSDNLKWLSFADLHLRAKERWGGKNPETAVDIRTEDKLKAVSVIVEKAIKEDYDAVIGIGDLFDSPTPPDWLVTSLIDTLTPLIKEELPFFYILGNHGTTFKSYGMKAIKHLLAAIENSSFFVVDKPTSFCMDNTNFWLIPEMPKGDLIPALKRGADKNQVLFAHLCVQDARVGGIKLDGISRDLLAGYEMCQLGDIHKAQHGRNWAYCGSTARKDFGEVGEQKGFLEGSIRDGRAITRFLPLQDREFVKVLASEDQVEYLPNAPEIDGAIIKLVCTGTKAWFRSGEIDKLVSELQEQGALEVSIESDLSDFTGRREEALEKDSSTKDAMSLLLKKEEVSPKDAVYFMEVGEKLLKTNTTS